MNWKCAWWCEYVSSAWFRHFSASSNRPSIVRMMLWSISAPNAAVGMPIRSAIADERVEAVEVARVAQFEQRHPLERGGEVLHHRVAGAPGERDESRR